MKNKQVIFQSIKDFQRVVNPDQRRYHYSAPPNAEGKYIVWHLADYKGNYYKNAGLQIGDEIIAVNDSLYKEIDFMQRANFHLQDTLFFDIIREGNPMKLVIPVDKNEQQGD